MSQIKKKRIILAGILVSIIVMGSIAFLLSPQNVINKKESFYITQVLYKGEDVTGQVDCDTLSLVLGTSKCSRLPYSFAPYQISKIEIEIYGNADNKPLYVLLGDINVVYRSAEKGGYSIRNSKKLLAEILQVMEQ